MIWIYTAIFSHFLWAVTNIGDKFFVINRIKNPQIYMLVKTLFGAFFSILILPFVDFVKVDVRFLCLSALFALLFLAGNYFYIKAVQVEEISRINIYWSFIPFFSFIIAWFALGEKLSGRQIIAMGFLICGAIIAGLNIKDSTFKLSKGFWLMAVSCFIYAVSVVVMKFLTVNIPFLMAFFYTGIFFTIFSAIPFLFKKVRSGFKTDFKKRDICLAVFGLIFLDEIAAIFNYFSVSKGPVALVYSMEGFQIIFVFLMTALIAYFTKIDLQENFETKNVFVKIVALFTMIIGINLL